MANVVSRVLSTLTSVQQIVTVGVDLIDVLVLGTALPRAVPNRGLALFGKIQIGYFIHYSELKQIPSRYLVQLQFHHYGFCQNLTGISLAHPPFLA